MVWIIKISRKSRPNEKDTRKVLVISYNLEMII